MPGMAHIDRNGGVNREIRVILDPGKLQAQGITAGAVNQQLRLVNLNAAGGRAQIGGSEQAVRVLGNANTAYDLGQTQISLGAGRTIKLADIAQIRDLYAEQRSASALNGRSVLNFDFQRAKGGSDVSVFHGAEAKLAALEKRYPKVHFELIFNQVKYTELQYHSAIDSMIEGAVLAVIVVFVFLRDWRSTVISALAIPLSAIPTFWFMDLMGFTLNGISLLALSLVAGVLVDDAIVAVFLPVGLMPGISGQFFKNFGLTVVVAVLMSLAVARLITPMIAAYFLKAEGHRAHGEGAVMNVYMVVLRWTLLHRWSAVVGGMGALALTVVCAGALPMTFQPDQDSDASTATIEMVPGTTLAQTQAVVNQVATLLQRQPDVESTYQRASVGNGRVTAIFKPKKTQTSKAFESALAPQLA